MRNKIGRMLLSVVVALGMWWYVISAVSPGFTDTVHNIPVVLDGEEVLNDRGLMITAMSTNRVALKLSGNRSNVVRINAENTTARVDVSKIYEVGTQIPVSYTPSFAREFNTTNIAVDTFMPSTIYLTVSRLSTKEIPVEIRWIGSAGDGFITDRENCTMDYTTITISGPEEVTDVIEKACVEVDLTGRTESISENLPYTLCDEGGTPVDAKLVTTNVESVRLDVKIQKVREINLICNVEEGGGARANDAVVTLNQTTLRVAGSESALDAMGDELVVGTIHLGEITHSGTVSLPITLPAGVRNLTGETEVTAEVILTGLASKELSLSNIYAVNAPEGTVAEIITKSMTVTVRGPAALVSGVTNWNVTVTVDLTGAELGTTTYKPSFTFTEGFEALGVMRSEPVSVSLQEK